MAGTLTIHYGLPGTGKTLFAMNDVIIPAVKQGRPFFTNITGISLSGLYAVTDVHQSSIRYYPVKDIGDVIRYFDDASVCVNGVFVLDEMKDFVDNDRAVQWLESRINVMRKQTVDFVLIAQLPEKEYIHPHIIELADSCNVAVSRKKYGDTDHVDWYYVDGGLPRIVNKIPKNAAGKRKRAKPVEAYSTYKTSENAFYTGQEDKTYRGLMWWQTRTARLRFVVVGLIIVVLALMVFGAYQFKSLMSPSKNKTLETEVKHESLQNVRSMPGYDGGRTSQPGIVRMQNGAISELFGAPPKCYKWKICTETNCRTDVGTYALEVRGAPGNRLCDSRRRCIEPCQDDSVLSSGRRLLRPGDSLSARN